MPGRRTSDVDTEDHSGTCAFGESEVRCAPTGGSLAATISEIPRPDTTFRDQACGQDPRPHRAAHRRSRSWCVRQRGDNDCGWRPWLLMCVCWGLAVHAKRVSQPNPICVDAHIDAHIGIRVFFRVAFVSSACGPVARVFQTGGRPYGFRRRERLAKLQGSSSRPTVFHHRKRPFAEQSQSCAPRE